MGFLSALTVLGSILGFLVFIVGVMFPNGAPGEAAAAAAGMALAVIPYVVLRCAQIGAQRRRDEELIAAVRGRAEVK